MKADIVDVQAKEEKSRGMVQFFCGHLVAVAGSYVSLDSAGQASGEESFFALSSFVLSVRDAWCLVTAGHAIQELEKGIRDRDYRLTNCCLGASFGSNPQGKDSIPFDIETTKKLYIYDTDDGLDFALLMLSPEQRNELEKNGIRAISERDWVRQHLVTFEGFALLGLPTCLVKEHRRLVPYGDTVAGKVEPAMVAVERVELPPDEMPASRYPWFVGSVGAAKSLPDIDGMSGGPIFGFAHQSDGRLRYWIVAVQSQWSSERRIIFACPVQIFAGLVQHQLQSYVASQEM